MSKQHSSQNKSESKIPSPRPPKENLKQNSTQEEVDALVQRISHTPALLTPHDMRHLQRTIGNQAVGRLLGKRLSPQSIQKKENKTGLPDDLKVGVENLSGMALDDVKVHYNSSKPAELQALAYTQGTDIHVAPGHEKHLSHEAWHVVQQKQGKVSPTMHMGNTAINDNHNLEKEADIMGNKASLQFSKIATNDQAAVYRADNSMGNKPIIQMMRVVRWMDADKENDYISKLANKDPETYKQVYRELIQGGKGKIMSYLHDHGENMLGDNTPFVSVGVNPYSLSWGSDSSQGGVDVILQNTPHNIWFDVPGEYLYPGVTPLSQAETELLALLPPGDTLKNYIATIDQREGIESNRWRGMSTQERQQALQELNPQFERLNFRFVEEDEPGTFYVTFTNVPAPWERENESLKFSDLPEEIKTRVLDLAEDNWAGGPDAFLAGLKANEKWAIDHLNTTIEDNQDAIRKAMQ